MYNILNKPKLKKDYFTTSVVYSGKSKSYKNKSSLFMDAIFAFTPLLMITGNRTISTDMAINSYDIITIASITSENNIKREIRRKYFSFIKSIGLNREDMTLDDF